jgi:hypothetical protein
MKSERRAEILQSLRLLKGVHRSEWLALMKQDENKRMPYFIAEVANQMEGAVRELCPPGYEIDR